MAASSATTAVRCRGVVKDFGDGTGLLRVLHDIDVDFAAGQLSLLVGPSGCGKTTLISIIAGILSATLGEIDVFSDAVHRLKGDRLAAFRLQSIGFIFQQYNLMPSLTAAENAAVPLAAAGLRHGEAVKRAKAMLDRLDLSAHVDKLPSQLSGGQQQRVAIARALVNNPRLVVCDEPTAALDARSGHRVMELLRDVAVAADRACIVVTHDSRVFDLADRIVAMEDGRIAQTPARNLEHP
jgi:putative ABC transport system ATP-binding protein